jgi:hypothetical protein
MGVAIDGGGSTSATSTTDTNGIATLNQLDGSSASAYYANGSFTIVATSGSASVTFNLTVGGTPSSLLSTTIIAGNNQSVARTGSQYPGGIATFAPLQVKVLNANGQQASGVQVGFKAVNTPQGMGVQFTPSTLGGTFVITDANGIGTVNQLNGNSMQCFNGSGPFTIAVYTTGGGQITFNETVSS